jgi:alcohol dehydrogenase, propanol-preferring
MRALRLTAWQQPPVVLDVPDPEPRGTEVLLRVGGAGLCHSDLHLVHDFTAEVAPFPVPFTLGHENAGWVAAVGPDVHGLELGTAVAVYGHWGCGICPRCESGLENHCDQRTHTRATGGVGRDGGMAELMLVPHPRLLLPLDGLTPVEAAPLTDAGLTAYHAVVRSRQLLTDEATVLVIGVGGLGHLAVQVLRAESPRTTVLAVDRRSEARADALRHGASHALAFDDATATQVRDLTAGQGVELVLDFVGSTETMQLGMSVARAFGHVTVVGIAGGSYRFSSLLAPHEVSLSTTYWGSRPELEQLLALAAAGVLKADIEQVPLESAPQALERLAAGDVRGRAVIVPSMES